MPQDVLRPSSPGSGAGPGCNGLQCAATGNVVTDGDRQNRPAPGHVELSGGSPHQTATPVGGHPSPFAALDARLNVDARAVAAPRVATFKEFLLNHARVPIGGGQYGPYNFTGREALVEIVACLDTVLGSDGAGGKPDSGPLKDSTLVLAGGAQFGKTILEQNLAAYLTGCRFLNCGVYLPDDKLADSIVDAKFRPDVVDQVPWFAAMTQVGKSVNKSGKAVNTKGAFLVTDGERKAIGMFRGLQRVPTSFSLDVVVRDEEDDIPRDKAKFLSGRLTASALRLQIIVGTQRVHGAGQNKKWEQGSQGVMMLGSAPKFPWAKQPEAGIRSDFINPEEHWPQICRVQMGGKPAATDPHLTFDGDFKRDGSIEVAATYTPDGRYYLAHPETGEPLDRACVKWLHRRPERIALRNWSWRISQLGIPAIDLAQIVAHWTRAVADGEEMISFCCDRLALPKSAAQALTPAILDRARNVAPFEFGLAATGSARFGGLDMGDRCWFIARERGPELRRVFRADKIAAGDVVSRVRALFAAQQLTALFIDERPLVNESRTLALLLNGLEGVTFPRVDWASRDAHVSLPGGLTWDGRNQRWLNLKCAVVRFTKAKLGQGVQQTVVTFEEGGQTKAVPCIECNRFETIDRVVREFLTPAENVVEVVNGKVRETPAILLPTRKPGSPAILETLDAHLLAGSQREKDNATGELGDYVDQCENHLLLADGYSALAELVCAANRSGPFAFQRVELGRGARTQRGVLAL